MKSRPAIILSFVFVAGLVPAALAADDTGSRGSARSDPVGRSAPKAEVRLSGSGGKPDYVLQYYDKSYKDYYVVMAKNDGEGEAR